MARGKRPEPAPAGSLIAPTEPVRGALLVDCSVDGRRLAAGTVVDGPRARLVDLFGPGVVFSAAQVAHNLSEGAEVVAV